MLKEKLKNLADHLESVKPGQPFRFTEASTVKDRVWQGDMSITIVDGIPPNYKRDNGRVQLVKGNTQGARHCIENPETCDVYVADDWDEESLDGPFVFCKEATNITHPIHGPVFTPKGFTIQIGYQREYDMEQKKEIRARD